MKEVSILIKVDFRINKMFWHLAWTSPDKSKTEIQQIIIQEALKCGLPHVIEKIKSGELSIIERGKNNED